MQERSDKKLEHLKSYVVEIAMLEFIKDNNLIDIKEYKKIKNKTEDEYEKYNKLNNSEYSFVWRKYLKYAIIQQLWKGRNE